MEAPNEQMIAAVAVVGAFLQIIKDLPYSNYVKPWSPLISVGLGVLCVWQMGMEDPIMTGIMVGLSAVGGYEFLKKKRKETPNGTTINNTTNPALSGAGLPDGQPAS